MTSTVGYFNNNSYPLRMDCSDLGINFDLAPKKYILQRDPSGGPTPIKVNDPYFDRYCAGGMLSKESTPDGHLIPIIPVPRKNVPPAPQPGAYGFSGTPNTNAQPVSGPQPNAGDFSIHGMSVAEAQRRGVFKTPNAVIPDDFGAAADAPGQAPKTGSELPSITEIARPQRQPALLNAPPRHVGPQQPQQNSSLPDALRIDGPPPSLEETDSTPAEVLQTGLAKPTAPPQPILSHIVDPSTGRPMRTLAARPMHQRTVEAASTPMPDVQFPEEVQFDSLPHPDLDGRVAVSPEALAAARAQLEAEASAKPKAAAKKGGRAKKNVMPKAE
jgi:hypothetical protein